MCPSIYTVQCVRTNALYVGGLSESLMKFMEIMIIFTFINLPFNYCIESSLQISFSKDQRLYWELSSFRIIDIPAGTQLVLLYNCAFHKTYFCF